MQLPQSTGNVFLGTAPKSWSCIFGRILGNTARGRLLLMQRNSIFLDSTGYILSFFHASPSVYAKIKFGKMFLDGLGCA